MLRRSGKFVIVGLFGGDATFARISMLFKMAAIRDSYVGSLPDFHELMALGSILRITGRTDPVERARPRRNKRGIIYSP
jgi:D-arabinose 1-dehydrogenase-like Zn-dependent alcohol dehydrogenase